jgi:hypothetical protein
MRAYLIDPFTRTVELVHVEDTPAVSIREQLSQVYRLLDCEYVEAIHLGSTKTNGILLVDEYGKVNGKIQQYFICDFFLGEMLAGKGLWLGSDGPNWTDCPLDRDQVMSHIVWMHPLPHVRRK